MQSPQKYHTSEAVKVFFFLSHFLILDTKPHQDVLREEKIKIVSITEVRGVRGNCIHVIIYSICFLLDTLSVGDYSISDEKFPEKWWHLFVVFFQWDQRSSHMWQRWSFSVCSFFMCCWSWKHSLIYWCRYCKTVDVQSVSVDGWTSFFSIDFFKRLAKKLYLKVSQLAHLRKLWFLFFCPL